MTKKAIDAALKSNWKKAIEINTQILEEYPNNLDTSIRLGRAYIQTKKFSKAKKIFKEVLKEDPINSIAKKNLELAKIGKTKKSNGNGLKTKALLKEPGTTQEIRLDNLASRITADKLDPGEELFLKIKKKSIDVFKSVKERKSLIGTIENEYVVNRVNAACEKKGKSHATFTRGKDKEIYILIKCDLPVFKADKIDVRPYLKKGTIDEPEIEMDEESEDE
ncbi:tetratricopeptide repeat protein [Patescibacteria group bacterium]